MKEHLLLKKHMKKISDKLDSDITNRYMNSNNLIQLKMCITYPQAKRKRSVKQKIKDRIKS
jgi:hypothetical protein